MTYFDDVYKKRGNWWGTTSKEQYLNIGKKYFEDYLLTSPNADQITIHNIDTLAAIHDNKQDENKLTKYFLIPLDITVSVGDLTLWYDDYWLVLRKEKRTLESYNKVLVIRCNYNLKWIDDYGVLNECWCYLFSSMSNKVEDNFRTWNGLITPLENKFLEIILPFKTIPKNQKFIIQNEAWRMVEKDLISANGILYMSLIEDNVDRMDDNVSLDIANYTTLNNSYIDIGITSLSIETGESFTFTPILYKNGERIEGATFVLSTVDNPVYYNINNLTITGITNGSGVLIISDSNSLLSTTCNINIISTSNITNILLIVGDENIKWGRTRTYTVFHHIGNTPVEINSTFTLLNNSNNFVTISSYDNTSCTLIANTSGLTGVVTLKATTIYGDITKDITVVSIW